MLFYIFLWLPLVFLLIGILGTFFKNEQMVAVGFAAGILLQIFLGIIVLTVWVDQADNLGTIEAQDKVIAVYQQQITTLTDRLNQFNYRPGALLNADSPVAAVVKSLTEVQEQLTDAQVKKVSAEVSIEKTRRGPMSGVISFVGDYK